MTATRTFLLERLWRGADPFLGFPANIYQNDTQGWGSTHRFLTETIAALRPRIVVEVGVWKGASVITMAEKLRALELDAAVVAVDTWLGSCEHWLQDPWFVSLGMEQGRPAMQRTFMANIVAARLEGHVVPLSIDSLNAFQLRGIGASSPISCILTARMIFSACGATCMLGGGCCARAAC